MELKKGFLLLAGCLLLMALIPILQGTPPQVSASTASPALLSASASADWRFPENISSDVPLYDWYAAGGVTYYYRTDRNAVSSYHVVGLQPCNIFDVGLYSDHHYSNSQVHTFGLDWVISRSFMIQEPLYFTIHTYSTSGNAYLKWDNGSAHLLPDTTETAYLDASNFFEAYTIHLMEGGRYWFNLSVPTGADFDFYLYYLAPAHVSNGFPYLTGGEAGWIGENELACAEEWQLTATDDYLLVIVRRSGAGTYTLHVTDYTVHHFDEIPLDPVFLLLGILGVSLLLKIKSRLKLAPAFDLI